MPCDGDLSLQRRCMCDSSAPGGLLQNQTAAVQDQNRELDGVIEVLTLLTRTCSIEVYVHFDQVTEIRVHNLFNVLTACELLKLTL